MSELDDPRVEVSALDGPRAEPVQAPMTTSMLDVMETVLSTIETKLEFDQEALEGDLKIEMAQIETDRERDARRDNAAQKRFYVMAGFGGFVGLFLIGVCTWALSNGQMAEVRELVAGLIALLGAFAVGRNLSSAAKDKE